MEGIQKEAGSGPFKKKHFSLARSLCHEFFPIEKQISLSLARSLSLSRIFSFKFVKGKQISQANAFSKFKVLLNRICK